MKRIFAFMATAIIGLSIAAGAASAQTIKFAVAAEPYPPFASKNKAGKWEGFEVDLANLLCAEMKAKCSIVEIPWDGIIPALTGKKMDVIFASMSITEERSKTIDFSIPYYNTPAAIMAPKTSTISPDIATMKGKTIGVQTATIHAGFADKFLKDVATIKIYNTQDEANSDLAAGRIDATIADSAALDPFIASDAGKALTLKGTFPKDPSIWGIGVGAGIRKGDPIKAKIDAAIRAVYKNGSYDTLQKKYFSYDVGTPPKS